MFHCGHIQEITSAKKIVEKYLCDYLQVSLMIHYLYIIKSHKRNRTMTTTTSTPAQTAKQIRTILKANFPGVKFSVTSESFSMGDAVRISWIDGPKTASVENLTKGFMYGHFDGSDDSYKMSNVNDSIPQVKYITTSRRPSENTVSDICEALDIDPTFYGSYNSERGEYNSALVHREFCQRSF